MDNQKQLKKENDEKNFLERIVEKHVIILILFMSVMFIVTSFLGNGILYILHITEFNNTVKYDLLWLVFYVVVGCFYLFLMYKLDVLDDIGFFSKKGMAKGLMMGIPIISSLIYQLFGFSSIWQSGHLPKGYEILVVIFNVLGIGFLEELSVRGFFLLGLLKHWQRKKYGVLYAVLVSSVWFGLSHFPRYNRAFVPSICHAGSTFMFGMLMATIFLYNKNIWSVIILHAIDDFLWSMRNYVFSVVSLYNESYIKGLNRFLGSSLPDTDVTNAVLQCIFDIPIFIAAIIYLVKIIKKQNKQTEKY